jgi:hypothetical protein
MPNLKNLTYGELLQCQKEIIGVYEKNELATAEDMTIEAKTAPLNDNKTSAYVQTSIEGLAQTSTGTLGMLFQSMHNWQSKVNEELVSTVKNN